MKLLVIIPAYNEEESLPAVVEGLALACPEYDYLIVNDGSTDGTGELCRRQGYNMMELPVNIGLAGAVQAGLRYAAVKGYDAAIQFDADGQHLPQYIRPLAEKLQEGYDIVIGSRFITVKKPKSMRIFGSYLISFAMRFATRDRICDPTSGMRIYNRNMIEKFAMNMNFSPEPDTISHLLRCGARVCEVQVEMNERTAGTSYFNFVRSVKYMCEMAVSILVIQWFRRNELEDGVKQA